MRELLFFKGGTVPYVYAVIPQMNYTALVLYIYTLAATPHCIVTRASSRKLNDRYESMQPNLINVSVQF